MRHPTDGTLRSYHDGELQDADRRAVEDHIGACGACRARLERLAAQAEQVNHALAHLGPGSFGQAQPHRALARLQATVEGSRETTMLEKIKTSKRWQRALAGIAVLAVLAGLFSLTPVRAFASDLLGMFRVERFVVVDVNRDRLEEIDAVLGQDFYFGEQEVIQEPGDPVEVASLDEATAMLGWAPRAPEGYGPGSILVTGAGRMRFTPDVESLRLAFEALELDPMLLPDNIDGQPFTFTVPAGVAQTWDETDGLTLSFMQMPSPTAEVPDGVDMRALGEAMLQMLGMTPEEAARLSATIDWTTTLVLPLPSDLGQVQEVPVDGTTGLLFASQWQQEGGDWVKEVSLLWQKGGFVYLVAANGDRDVGNNVVLSLAEALP
jgi:hypothetical protein